MSLAFLGKTDEPRAGRGENWSRGSRGRAGTFGVGQRQGKLTTNRGVDHVRNASI